MYVENGVRRAEAGKGIDVAVRIVASKIAVFQPEDALGVEVMEQAMLYFLAGEVGVAMGREQALAGGKQGAASVALDAPALEDEVEVRDVDAAEEGGRRRRGGRGGGTGKCGEGRIGDEAPADLIIEVSGELVAPAVELEVEELGAFGGDECEESVVTCPGVIGRALEIADGRQKAGGKAFGQEGLDAVWLWSYNEQTFVVVQYFVGNVNKALINFGKEVCPVGGGMRPSELHSTLRMPLGREEGVAQVALLLTRKVGEVKVQREVADCGSSGSVVEWHGEFE